MSISLANFKNRMNLIVGFFVFSTLIVIVTAFAVIFATQGIFGPKYSLYAIFPDGIGLRKGTSVLFNGVQIGVVDQIDLIKGNGSLHVKSTGNVVLKMTLDDKFKSFITDKSIAFVMRDKNLVSDRVINIESSEYSQNILANNDTLQISPSRDIETVLTGLTSLMDKVDVLVVRADEILAKVVDTSSTVGSMLGSKELYDTIMADLSQLNSALSLGQNVLDNARKLEEDVGMVLPGILNNADTTFQNIVGTSQNLDKLVGKLNGISQNVTHLLGDVEDLMDEGKGELENASELIDAVSKFWFIRGKIKKENNQDFPLLMEELNP